MNRLSLDLMELMGTSLGLKDEKYYRKFFEDGCAIFRCNYYPPCKQPDRALGTGPHRDPTALTILHQDGVSGLEVFTQGIWRTVRPYPGSFVINLGDLFVPMSEGKYNSCLHRAVLNKDTVRKSLVFFIFSRKDKLIVPPEELVSGDSRNYPEFTWSDYQKFVVSKYRLLLLPKRRWSRS
ncbi:PREDICTED: gibberellin 20 oxidase 5-like [Tarenaya hassleriana]|uniref:gibberellin 20 oxidase 5-like n=1 Tax=Tarenaya hassleriana TaxID=28532 RepID=UPI00053C3508|nr:PREDICTED: gibberellin 20 oxidase 5-like [Tarenaya hassleriana]